MKKVIESAQEDRSLSALEIAKSALAAVALATFALALFFGYSYKFDKAHAGTVKPHPPESVFNYGQK
jgi:hypothetical protein